MDEPKVAILGAGNGAHAMAGHLGMKGFRVRLYNKFEEEIAAMREEGGVHVEGVVEGFGPVELVTTDPSQVVPWADIVMVVVPAFVHRFMAEVCAPHVRDGQVIILNPGRTGGALEFSQVLRQAGVTARVYVAEAQTLVYACRIKGPARVWISGIKKQVPVAALPATDTPAVLEVARLLYPEFCPAANVLETSLDNIGAVFHPTTVVFNANRIEAGEDFEFYRDMTPTVVSFLELVDDERLGVARTYGVHVASAKDWLAKTYNGVTGDTLYERIQSTRAYWGIKAPKTLNVRYITEDIPTGLVPIVSFARVAGLETPTSRAIVDICCGLHRRNYWAEGRTLQRLGLDGMGVQEIVAFVNGKAG